VLTRSVAGHEERVPSWRSRRPEIVVSIAAAAVLL